MQVYYRCPVDDGGCDHEWSEEYDCACDSECPNCGLGDITALAWDLDGDDAQSLFESLEAVLEAIESPGMAESAAVDRARRTLERVRGHLAPMH